MRVETDDRGRLPLPAAIRERHGQCYRLLNLPNRVVLIPIADDPVAAVRDELGDRFADVSLDEIRTEILEAAKTEIDAEVENRGDDAE